MVMGKLSAWVDGWRQSDMPLWKSTIIIWSDFDPRTVELEDLAREATNGDAYCSSQKAKLIDHPADDMDWDGTEFFSDSLE